MPELTVAMPTRDVGHFLHRAVDSVLRQEGVDFELVVVDDGSTDETGSVLGMFNDPRLRVIRNETPKGIARCHNQIINASSSPFITHVDSDDIILPGALAAVLVRIREAETIGQVHSPHCFEGNFDCPTLVRFRFWYRFWSRRPVSDYRSEMFSEGMVMNTLRTYRREVFESVGGFDETLDYAVDWEMGVRLLSKFQVVRVPHRYYMVREHRHNTSQPARFPGLKHIWKHAAISARLRSDGSVPYLRTWRYNPYRLLGRRLLRMWGYRVAGSVAIAHRTLRKCGAGVYLLCQTVFAGWPAGVSRRPTTRRASQTLKVGYYLWRYPSTTFVQREVEALSAAGVDVEVFADSPGDEQSPGMHLPQSAIRVNYRLPEDLEFLSASRRYFFRLHPIRYINLFWYTISKRYGSYKTFAEDRAVFAHAVYVAGMLRERGITHLHAPWADRNAFIGLLASKLLGIPYSVQARAHELHRDLARFALREKFANSMFVITNAEYNRDFISSYLSGLDPGKIKVIYEGVDTGRIKPLSAPARTSTRFEVLCVARLIEEKGLTVLMHASDLLRRRGLDFHITVIGGREDPAYTSYYVDLMRLHRRLHLRERVSFLGFQPFERVIQGYRECDIFVLPCVESSNGGRDITPNSIIEAMAMGLPIVTTHVGGIPELVGNMKNGILVAPGRAEPLADSIQQLAANAGLRRTLGVNARIKAKASFDIHRNIKTYAALFQGNPLAPVPLPPER